MKLINHYFVTFDVTTSLGKKERYREFVSIILEYKSELELYSNLNTDIEVNILCDCCGLLNMMYGHENITRDDIELITINLLNQHTTP